MTLEYGHLQHVSVAERAIHFGMKSVSAAIILCCINNIVVRDIARVPSGFMNVISSVPRDSVD